MNTRGMAIGQVFIFIVAAITFALIMIFGGKAIVDFIGQGEQVEFVQFKTDVETSVQQIYTEFGAIREKEFSLPPSYEQVCFVDLDYENEESVVLLRGKDPVAADAWQTAMEEGGYGGFDVNVFLTPTAPNPIKVHPIKMDNGFLCVDVVQGEFTILLEGKGDHTFLYTK